MEVSSKEMEATLRELPKGGVIEIATRDDGPYALKARADCEAGYKKIPDRNGRCDDRDSFEHRNWNSRQVVVERCTRAGALT
jgi:hypothetical protein